MVNLVKRKDPGRAAARGTWRYPVRVAPPLGHYPYCLQRAELGLNPFFRHTVVVPAGRHNLRTGLFICCASGIVPTVSDFQRYRLVRRCVPHSVPQLSQARSASITIEKIDSQNPTCNVPRVRDRLTTANLNYDRVDVVNAFLSKLLRAGVQVLFSS